MKKAIVPVLFSLLFLAQAKAQAGKHGLEITHLTGNLYVYTTYNLYAGNPTPSNSMYLVTGEGVVLFDVPWDTAQRQPLLDSLYARHHQKPVLCIATHFHGDRTGALDFLKQHGVATWSSRLTYELCRQNHMQEAAHVFDKDTSFTVGGYTVQTFYPGEGHTKDNIVIWCAADQVLYGGCLIKSTEDKTLGFLGDANLAAWPQTMRRLMQEFPHPKYVIPGHDGWADNQSPAHTLKLLEQRGKKS
ncbi:MAG TPA: BlaB/IND/MUS family subclass B1 metallo-beta-lactamase [Puia sp.]|nr:BlaB/IND/MUS family subclass B1 metallo-beta-lactamase [Puia sp.]